LSSQGFRDCEQNNGQYPTKETKFDKPSRVVVTNPRIIQTWFSCVGGFSNENAGAITALATVILTLSTIALWVATKESADVARRALTDLERPYIFIHSISWGEAPSDDDNSPPEDDNPFVRYRVSNEGRLPAIVDSITLGTTIGITPGAMHESDILEGEPIMPPSDRRRFAKGLPDDTPSSQAIFSQYGSVFNIPEIKPGEDFFFQIKIVYRGPFTRGHETAACWHMGKYGGLEPFGGDARNYVR
jgi:hypothetical protein